MDYYSQFFEVDFLKDLTSLTILSKLKSHFARYGLPENIYSDNGRQLVSHEFSKFCQRHSINHETSSPGNSRANGAAEAAVKVAKSMMKNFHMNKEDPYIALLNLRNKPQEGIEYSPVQRLMGRRTKTMLPTVPNFPNPANVNSETHRLQREVKQRKMADKYLDRPTLLPLQKDDMVRVQPIRDDESIWKKATVKDKVNSRSYIVETEDGKQYRRDRQQLRKKILSQEGNITSKTY